jgi:ribosome-associated protein
MLARGRKRIAALSINILSEAVRRPLKPAKGNIGSDVGLIVRNMLTALEDAKAENIVSIDLSGKTTLADTMIIATGRSNVHVGAIADRVIQSCKDAGLTAPRTEGMPHCDWVLVDAGDVIVHVFRPEVRQFYNLEKMWGGDRPGEKRGR